MVHTKAAKIVTTRCIFRAKIYENVFALPRTPLGELEGRGKGGREGKGPAVSLPFNHSYASGLVYASSLTFPHVVHLYDKHT